MVNHFHLKTTVESSSGSVDVSTVDLSLPEFGITGKGYETCVFLPDGEGEVVAWYPSESDAALGHAAFCNPQVVAYVRSAVADRGITRQASC